MTTYQFEAMDATGQEIRDTIDATSEEEAQATIRQMGYFVTKISCKSVDRRASAAPNVERYERKIITINMAKWGPILWVIGAFVVGTIFGIMIGRML